MRSYSTGLIVLTFCLGSACVVPVASSGNVQFDETTTLGYSCAGGLLSSWVVSNVETQKQGTASCQQPVLFTDMRDGATYTFEISGYSPAAGNTERLCWRGSCAVRAVGSRTTYPDCSPQINHLCGY